MESESISKQILRFMEKNCPRPTDTILSLKIAHGVGKKTKKEINSHLYKLQKEGLIKKVVESPPTWQLVRQHEPPGSRLSAGLPGHSHTPTLPPVAAAASFMHWLHSSPGPQPTSNYGSYSQQSTTPFAVNAFAPEKNPATSHAWPTSHAEETRPKSVSGNPVRNTTVTKSAGDSQQQNRSEFVPPPSPRSILRGEFSALNLKDKTAHDVDLEQQVLEILSNNNKLLIQDIVRKIPGCEINAVNKALSSLLVKNSVQKFAGLYSLPYLNDAASITTAPKMIFAGEPCFTNDEFYTADDFTADSFDTSSFAFSAPYPPPPAPSPPAPSLSLPPAAHERLQLPEGKNAISVLNEFAQTRQWKINYQVQMSGPDHHKRFSMKIELGGQAFHGPDAATKKDAKLKAAEVALAALYSSRSIEIPGAEGAVYAAGSQQEATLHDKVATLVAQKYNDLAMQLPDTITGRKIIAGFVMSQTLKSGEKTLQVVSIGSGNRCVMGDKLSMVGQTVNDCHAEVISRRGLVRYFYQELLLSDRKDSIFVPDGEKFTLKPGIEFHLYISTAPCGDSAIFAPSDATTDQPNQDQGDGVHHPLFENKKQGVLRTKVENGEGCIPIEEDTAAPTWDGILRGERLRTMSCSDKIAKWNFLGLQGTLLSHFLKPIKMSTLTLGMLYNHGHLTRAVCCRVQKSVDSSENEREPSALYKVQHPAVSGQNQNSRETGKLKTREFSLNWIVGDGKPEVLDGTEGRCEQRFGSHGPPRICKAELFKDFKKVCDKTGRAELYKDGYYKSKTCATAHVTAKRFMWEALEKSGFGKWMPKPKEEKDF